MVRTLERDTTSYGSETDSTEFDKITNAINAYAPYKSTNDNFPKVETTDYFLIMLD